MGVSPVTWRNLQANRERTSNIFSQDLERARMLELLVRGSPRTKRKGPSQIFGQFPDQASARTSLAELNPWVNGKGLCKHPSHTQPLEGTQRPREGTQQPQECPRVGPPPLEGHGGAPLVVLCREYRSAWVQEKVRHPSPLPRQNTCPNSGGSHVYPKMHQGVVPEFDALTTDPPHHPSHWNGSSHKDASFGRCRCIRKPKQRGNNSARMQGVGKGSTQSGCRQRAVDSRGHYEVHTTLSLQKCTWEGNI